MSHYLWIPFVILYYIIYSCFSRINNNCSELIIWYQQKWFWITFIFGAICPFWVIITRTSKNLLFDGILYDNIMFLTYTLTIICLGGADKFVTHQWFGLGLVVLGSILMRIGFN